jgi:hypothetical protein
MPGIMERTANTGDEPPRIRVSCPRDKVFAGLGVRVIFFLLFNTVKEHYGAYMCQNPIGKVVRMPRLLIPVCAVLLSTGIIGPNKVCAAGLHQRNKEVPEQIQTVYMKKLKMLNPKTRAHFAIRMYRITGDTSYIQYILPYARLTAASIKGHLDMWDSAGYRQRMAGTILSRFPDSEKNRRRIKLLRKEPEFVFYRDVLEQVYQMKSLGLEEDMGPALDEAVKRLSIVNWEKLLLDTALIREYASKLANYMYYLKLLDVADLENEYTQAFKAVFMNGQRNTPGKLEYQNMIYGMTHFVLAGSGYLQQNVDAKKYAWILDYFDAHIKEILARSKPDVIAEVGLCFKLCGRKDHRVVAMTQRQIVKAFDPAQGIIPPPGKAKKIKYGKSEHRNIMACLLLTDFGQLYPGPHIRKIPVKK